jgi:hypothetical protein
MAYSVELGRRADHSEELCQCCRESHQQTAQPVEQHLHQLVLQVLYPSPIPVRHIEIHLIIPPASTRPLRALTQTNSYTGSNVVGDISYDIYFGNDPTGGASYEVMIWLARLGGAFPMSYTNEAIATLTIAGTSFHLYKGPHGGNGASTIFTFVADSEQSSYNGDLLGFFDYLVDNEGVSSSLHLQSIGAGMEAFTGSNVNFQTSTYTMSVE